MFSDRAVPSGPVPQDGSALRHCEGQGSPGTCGAPEDGHMSGAVQCQPRRQALACEAGGGRQDQLQRQIRRGQLRNFSFFLSCSCYLARIKMNKQNAICFLIHLRYMYMSSSFVQHGFVQHSTEIIHTTVTVYKILGGWKGGQDLTSHSPPECFWLAKGLMAKCAEQITDVTLVDPEVAMTIIHLHMNQGL